MSTTTTKPRGTESSRSRRVTARPTTNNVLKAFWQASPEEFETGRAWYFNARKLAEELAQSQMTGYYEDLEYNEKWDVEVSKAVAVVAVLSPRLSWDKNSEYARLAYKCYSSLNWLGGADAGEDYFATLIPTLNANARKAFRILDGEKPEDVVSGPKVTAFYYAILDGSDPRGIVIDRHAFDVAVGRVMDDRTRGIVLGRAGAYESFVRAYERATVELKPFYPDVTPAEVQAVCWVAWRRTKKES